MDDNVNVFLQYHDKTNIYAISWVVLKYIQKKSYFQTKNAFVKFFKKTEYII